MSITTTARPTSIIDGESKKPGQGEDIVGGHLRFEVWSDYRSAIYDAIDPLDEVPSAQEMSTDYDDLADRSYADVLASLNPLADTIEEHLSYVTETAQQLVAYAARNGLVTKKTGTVYKRIDDLVITLLECHDPEAHRLISSNAGIIAEAAAMCDCGLVRFKRTRAARSI